MRITNLFLVFLTIIANFVCVLQLFCLQLFPASRSYSKIYANNNKVKPPPPKIKLITRTAVRRNFSPQSFNCTMSKSSCFNASRPACAFNVSHSTDGLIVRPKVFVYAEDANVKMSKFYAKMLALIRGSEMFTDHPESACIFVLSKDTIDRDPLGRNYLSMLRTYIKQLPATLWNNGINHLIFNLFFGTYPFYDYDLRFNPGMAMISWASAAEQVYRKGFDVSFPLFNDNHPMRSIPERLEVRDVRQDTIFLSFKGKRYVFGHGTEVRNNVHTLHNNRTIVMLTTCQHTKKWQVYRDARCDIDNAEYETWDYFTLMKNSTFCLTPRGRRLGSFRFLETLRFGCIPVVLADGLILPFAELIDWKTAAIVWPEQDLLSLPDYLKKFSAERIMEMRRNVLQIYHRYFNSIERIMATTFELIFDRIRRVTSATNASNDDKYVSLERWWSLDKKNMTAGQLGNGSNTAPADAEYDDDPSVTVVVRAHSHRSAQLGETLIALSELRHLRKTIVLWPQTRGSVTEQDNYNSGRFKVKILDTSTTRDSDFLKVDGLWWADSEFLIFIDELIPFNISALQDALRYAATRHRLFISCHVSMHENNRIDNTETSNTIKKWSIVEPTVISIKSNNTDVPNNNDALSYSFGWLQNAVVHRSLVERFQWKFVRSGVSPTVVPLLATTRSSPASDEHCYTLWFNALAADLTRQAPLWWRYIRSIEDATTIEAGLRRSRTAATQCLNQLQKFGFGESVPLITATTSEDNDRNAKQPSGET